MEASVLTILGEIEDAAQKILAEAPAKEEAMRAEAKQRTEE